MFHEDNVKGTFGARFASSKIRAFGMQGLFRFPWSVHSMAVFHVKPYECIDFTKGDIAVPRSPTGFFAVAPPHLKVAGGPPLKQNAP
jgi:hypothetical protein